MQEGLSEPLKTVCCTDGLCELLTNAAPPASFPPAAAPTLQALRRWRWGLGALGRKSRGTKPTIWGGVSPRDLILVGEQDLQRGHWGDASRPHLEVCELGVPAHGVQSTPSALGWGGTGAQQDCLQIIRFPAVLSALMGSLDGGPWN